MSTETFGGGVQHQKSRGCTRKESVFGQQGNQEEPLGAQDEEEQNQPFLLSLLESEYTRQMQTAEESPASDAVGF